MMQESVCTRCNSENPLKACICNQSITLLCKSCIGEHIEKFPDFHHSFISIEYANNLHTSSSLNILKDHLQAKRWELDLCTYRDTVIDYIKTIELNRDALLDDIIHTTQHHIKSLNIVLDGIDYNLLKLQSHMNFPHQQSQNILDQLEKNGLPSTLQHCPQQLVMQCDALHQEIKNMIQFTPSISSLQNNATPSIYEQNQSHSDLTLSEDTLIPIQNTSNIEEIYVEPLSYIYHLLPDTKQLIQYDTSSNTIQVLHITSSSYFSENYSMCKLPNGDLFICGGYSTYCYMKEAFIINLTTLKRKNLPDMNYERGYHACIYLNNSVYAFGGKNDYGSLSSCEEFNFETQKWQSLGYMKRGVHNFNICIMEDKIYIPSIGYFDPIYKKIDYIALNTDKGLPIPLKNALHILSSEHTRIQILQPGRELQEITYTGTSFWSFSFISEYEDKFYFINQGERSVYEYDPELHILLSKISF